MRTLPELLQTLDGFFSPTEFSGPIRAGRGTDILYGSRDDGRDDAGGGADLVIGREGIAEVLQGGAGADTVIAQDADTVVVEDGDLVVLAGQKITLLVDPGDLGAMTVALPGMVRPMLDGISADGTVTVVDAVTEARISFLLLDADGDPFEPRRLHWVEKKLDLVGDDALTKFGLHVGGQGTGDYDVVYGGAEMEGGDGRDLLIATSETTIMKGGAGGDLLIVDMAGREGGVVLDGGAGFLEGGGPGIDGYVITGYGSDDLPPPDPNCLIWDLVDGSTGEQIDAIPDDPECDIWDFLGSDVAGSGAHPRPEATKFDFLYLPEFDDEVLVAFSAGDGAFEFKDPSGLVARLQFETNDGRLIGPGEALNEFVGRIYVGEDFTPLTEDNFVFG